MNIHGMRKVLDDISREAFRAATIHKPMNSPHEGWAVILEEIDELWDEVKKNERDRSIARMRDEAVQIAAMAARFILDVCDADIQG